MQSDDELIRSVLAGCRESFDPLVRRYEASVLASAAAVLGDLEAARDASQEAFLVAYRKLGSLRRPEAFGWWVGRIAKRQALSHLRQCKREPQGPHVEEPALPAGGDGRQALSEDHDRLLAAVARLPEQDRAVLTMRYFDGLKLEEIAKATGKGIGTISKQLSRSHKRLREMLGDNP